MGLFSRNYDRDRVSIQQLRDYVQANGLPVSTCQDNGTTAVLEVPTPAFEMSVRYQKELSMTQFTMYPMYYSASYTQEQIRRIIVDGINAPSMNVKVSVVGNAWSFSLAIQMNHRYFSIDEFEKNLERLSNALEKAGEVCERKGILD